MIRAKSERHNTALLLITHNLGVVARYADRVNVMYAGRIVERATADELYDRPRHPYTLGLMRSVPRLDQPSTEKLQPIQGQPPDPIDLPEGCPFHPRCPFAIDKCTRDLPPLVAASETHAHACWVDPNG
jgi:oligopeptide transport system ATP-binding protein